MISYNNLPANYYSDVLRDLTQVKKVLTGTISYLGFSEVTGNDFKTRGCHKSNNCTGFQCNDSLNCTNCKYVDLCSNCENLSNAIGCADLRLEDGKNKFFVLNQEVSENVYNDVRQMAQTNNLVQVMTYDDFGKVIRY